MNDAENMDFVDRLFQKAFNEPAPSMPDLPNEIFQTERLSDNDLDFVTAAGVPMMNVTLDSKSLKTE